MKKVETTEAKVTRTLHELGFSPSVRGFHYLRSGILKCFSDILLAESITTKLYPLIAKEYESTPQRVERAIRHSIEKAFKEANEETYQKLNALFIIPKGKTKPTNADVIASLADSLRIGTI